VRAHLERMRPVTAEVYVCAPVPRPVDFEIRLKPDTRITRDAVRASLQGLIQREGALGAEILISHLHQAIGAQVNDYVLMAPTDNVAVAAHEIATFGRVQWR
jgi:uncharacterized phage protein gp47/JayE